jgi:glycosyltransferase involved in cell wall biosynthesis
MSADATVKVLHVVEGLDPETNGGVARAVRDLGTGLTGAGWPVAAVVADDRVPDGWGEVRFAADLGEAVRACDVVHIHGVWSPLFGRAAAAAARWGKGRVHTPHGMLDGWSMRQRRLKKQVFLRTVNRRLRHGGHLHATAEQEKVQALEHVRPDHSWVIPYVIDLADYQEKPTPAAMDGQGPLVIYVSRLHPKKNTRMVLDAVAKLPNVRLAVVGNGDEAYTAELRRRAEQPDLAGRVTMPGFVAGAELRGMYAAGDLLVLPTSSENFGLALLESMACGTPVLTTRGTDIWQEVEQLGGTVLPLEGLDAATLAAAMERLLTDPVALAASGATARAKVLAEYDAEQVVPRYLGMYRAAAGATT